MKQLYLTAAAAVLSCAWIIPAHAEDAHGLYASLAGGVAANNEVEAFGTSLTLSDGYSLAGEVGYDFGAVRVGAEARRLSGSTNIGVDINTQATTLMANVYLEPFAIGDVQPYVMAGYGRINAEASALFFSGSLDGSAYQYGAGASYPLSAKLSLDAGWRHIEADDLGGLSFSDDVLQAGLRLAL